MTHAYTLTEGALRFRPGLEIDEAIIDSFRASVDTDDFGKDFGPYIDLFNNLVTIDNHLFNYVSDLMEFQVDNPELSDSGWLALRKFFQYACLVNRSAADSHMKTQIRNYLLLQEHATPYGSDDLPRTMSKRETDLSELYEECSMTSSPVDMDLFFHSALFNDPALLRVFVYKFYLGR